MSECFPGPPLQAHDLERDSADAKKSAVILQAPSSERFDHQPAVGVSATTPHANADAKRTYFCRGCGVRLQPGFRGHFHKECLRADKRRRVQGQRQLGQRRFEAWLQRQHCPKCGERYGGGKSGSATTPSREASQRAKERNSLGS